MEISDIKRAQNIFSEISKKLLDKRVKIEVNPVRKSSTFQRGGSHGALNPMFALKGIISSSPLQAAGLSNGVNRLIS